jgi:hypothetical protein
MKERTVSLVIPTTTSIDRSPDPNDAWSIEVVREDNIKWNYSFPTNALWGRSAEYGIDPSDSHTLLDVVWYELILMEHNLHVRVDDPTFVYNTDQKTAREAHLARIEHGKTLVKHHDPSNLLDAIHQHHADTFHNSPHRDFHKMHSASVAEIRKLRMRGLSA